VPCSFGESFLAPSTNRVGSSEPCVPDEPEAAPSPIRQRSALARIHQCVREASRFVIAKHAAILLAYPKSISCELPAQGIRKVAYEKRQKKLVTKPSDRSKARVVQTASAPGTRLGVLR
jgi:predicted ATPase